MATVTQICEISVLEVADRVTASLPRHWMLSDAELSLTTPPRTVRRVGTLLACRTEGYWRAGRRAGRATVDVVPAGPVIALVSVVLHDVPSTAAPDLATRLARISRDRAEGRIEPAPLAVPTPPRVSMWKTARP
ncbi:MAG: hypothetical protein KY469_20425 [Actinobacteria bacterium]|nr:hypothetical protein [Actinomycetota bacterium]